VHHVCCLRQYDCVADQVIGLMYFIDCHLVIWQSMHNDLLKSVLHPGMRDLIGPLVRRVYSGVICAYASLCILRWFVLALPVPLVWVRFFGMGDPFPGCVPGLVSVRSHPPGLCRGYAMQAGSELWTDVGIISVESLS